MTLIKTVALAIVMLTMGTNAYGGNSSANEILKKVAATYKTMKTYKCEGTRTSVTKSSIGIGTGGGSFTILLKKPNMYLITWTSATLPQGHYIVLWSDGSQPYLFNGMHTFGKMTSDDMALRKASMFGGPVYRIPLLFLSDLKEHNVPFSEFINPKIENVEKIGEEDCYVISGSSAVSKKVTIWISKTSYLIRKYERSIEPPEGGKRRPRMTDEEKEKAKRNVEEFKRRKMSGYYREVYTEISSPELKKEDFNFALPEGSVFRDNWPRD